MSLSRRQFLKGAAIAGSGMAISGLVENISETAPRVFYIGLDRDAYVPVKNQHSLIAAHR